jgi:hypothetical protein
MKVARGREALGMRMPATGKESATSALFWRSTFDFSDVISGQDSPAGKAVDSPEDKSAADTESQLLELEFRARALKSLMQARQRHDT